MLYTPRIIYALMFYGHSACVFAMLCITFGGGERRVGDMISLSSEAIATKYQFFAYFFFRALSPLSI